MKRSLLIFVAGAVAGSVLTLVALRLSTWTVGTSVEPQTPPVCYSCAWEGYDAKVRSNLIEFYRQYLPDDPLLFGDARFVLWRATGTPNCDILDTYRRVASSDPSPFRRYLAATIVGFTGPECGRNTRRFFQEASGAAARAGLATESKLLAMLAGGERFSQFADVEIQTRLEVPLGAKTLVLGESAIRLTPGMRVGTQVDRVMRDWISAQLRWAPSDEAVPAPLLDYHEGALVRRLQEIASVQLFPLAGTLVAQKGDQWFAPDESGVFRFEVLPDKLQYPTAHAAGSAAWIQDTHGISALVPAAVERRMELVVGCGDSEGKMKAAYHLAARGIHVFVPGDRYIDELLGYQAPGVILGGAPIHKRSEEAVIGGQPVRFSLAETIVVQDTKKAFPTQYYDAGARYFRVLARHASLKLQFVEVDAPGQIQRVLDRAAQLGASAVAVRVMTAGEDLALRDWLQGSRKRRAVLFHSALYPYVQPLFRDFPERVTFGDLHPRFE